MQSALVVGSGFGGIASALRLRSLGLDVHVIERHDHIGGRAQVFEVDGYRHDAGPTVITAPQLIYELFQLFDKKYQVLNFGISDCSTEEIYRLILSIFLSKPRADNEPLKYLTVAIHSGKSVFFCILFKKST